MSGNYGVGQGIKDDDDDDDRGPRSDRHHDHHGHHGHHGHHDHRSPRWTATEAIAYTIVPAPPAGALRWVATQTFHSGQFTTKGGSLKITVACSGFNFNTAPPQGGRVEVDVILARANGTVINVLGTLAGFMSNNTSGGTAPQTLNVTGSPTSSLVIKQNDLKDSGGHTSPDKDYSIALAGVNLGSVTVPPQAGLTTGAMHISLVPITIYLTGSNKPAAGTYQIQLRLKTGNVDASDYCQATVEEFS